MRSLRFFALGTAFLLLTGIWACGPGETIVNIDVVASNVFPERGDEVELKITASSDNADLKEVSIVVSVADSTGSSVEVLNTTDEAKELSYEGSFKITIPDGAGITEKVNINVTFNDADGGKHEDKSDIEVVSYYEAFRSNAQFGHRFGSLAIGYNLKDAVEIFGDSPANSKDIVDNSEQNEDLSGVLVSNAQAGTQFIDLGSTYEISEINTGIVRSQFAENSGSTLISVTTGTIFLANVRGANDFVVVHVTEVDKEYSHQGATDNLGLYTVDIYKPKN